MRRSQTGEDTKDSGVFFLFSPSASYPQPFACLIDRRARIVHAWSSALEQPDPALDPPTYLRGWNHVELDGEGNLYALVPLHSLLKLRPDSTLAWRAQLPVHHDLDIGLTGVHVLTEEPRLIPWRGGTHVLLDNTVTILSRDGDFLVAHSLYDVLISHPTLRSLIDDEIGRRRASSPDLDAVARSYILNRSSGYHRGREVSRLLRDLPGSPADVLHANTVEILDAHPAGIWGHGDVLVSLRDLNLIAVLDLATGRCGGGGGLVSCRASISPPSCPAAPYSSSTTVTGWAAPEGWRSTRAVTRSCGSTQPTHRKVCSARWPAAAKGSRTATS